MDRPGTSTQTIEAASHAAFWKEAKARFPEERYLVTPMVNQGF